MRRSRASHALSRVIASPLSYQALCRAIGARHLLAGIPDGDRIVVASDLDMLLRPYLGNRGDVTAGLPGTRDARLVYPMRFEPAFGHKWPDEYPGGAWLVPSRDVYTLFGATGPADLAPALAALAADPHDLLVRLARLRRRYGRGLGVRMDCHGLYRLPLTRDLVARIVGGEADPLPVDGPFGALWRDGLGARRPHEWSIGDWARLALCARDVADLARLAAFLDAVWSDEGRAPGEDARWWRALAIAANSVYGTVTYPGETYGTRLMAVMVEGDGPWSIASRIAGIEPAVGDALAMQRAVWAVLLSWRRFTSNAGDNGPRALYTSELTRNLNPQVDWVPSDHVAPLGRQTLAAGAFASWWPWFLAHRWWPGRIRFTADGVLLAFLMALPAPVLAAAVVVAHDIALMTLDPEAGDDIGLDRFAAGPAGVPARLYFDGVALGRLAPLLGGRMDRLAEREAAQGGDVATGSRWRVDWFYDPARMLGLDEAVPAVAGLLRHEDVHDDTAMRLVVAHGEVASDDGRVGPVPLDVASAMSVDQMRGRMADASRALADAASRLG